MRTVQAVTLEQCEREENQGQRYSESYETAVPHCIQPTVVQEPFFPYASHSAQRFHTSSSMRMELCLSTAPVSQRYCT